MPTPAAVISFGASPVQFFVAEMKPSLALGAIMPASTAVEFALAVALDAGDADDLAAIDRSA